MDNQISNISREGISEMMKNTNIEIHMEGWPASVAIIAGFVSITVMYGMKVYKEQNEVIEKKAAA